MLLLRILLFMVGLELLVNMSYADNTLLGLGMIVLGAILISLSVFGVKSDR